MISSRSVCRTDHRKSEHFRKIGASGSPDLVGDDQEAEQARNCRCWAVAGISSGPVALGAKGLDRCR